VAGRNPLQFNVANEVWSLGAAGTQVLLNGGLTSAQVDPRAPSTGKYCQTVLTSFQQAEDQFAPVRILRQQLVMQQRGKDARLRSTST
jgi:outer membrane protein TolC